MVVGMGMHFMVDVHGARFGGDGHVLYSSNFNINNMVVVVVLVVDWFNVVVLVAVVLDTSRKTGRDIGGGGGGGGGGSRTLLVEVVVLVIWHHCRSLGNRNSAFDDFCAEQEKQLVLYHHLFYLLPKTVFMVFMQHYWER